MTEWERESALGRFFGSPTDPPPERTSAPRTAPGTAWPPRDGDQGRAGRPDVLDFYAPAAVDRDDVQNSAAAGREFDFHTPAAVDREFDFEDPAALDRELDHPHALDFHDPRAVDRDGPPGRRHRTRRRLLLAGVALLPVAAVALAGPTAWDIYRQRDTRLATPAAAAGLTLDSSTDARATAEYLRNALAAEMALDSSVAAVYSGSDRAHSVLFIGGTATILSPDRKLRSVLALLDDSGSGLTGVRDVAAGSYGGTMRCGTSPGADATGPADSPDDLSVCGWADHGSVGAALFPGRTLDQAADLMRRLRTALEHR